MTSFLPFQAISPTDRGEKGIVEEVRLPRVYNFQFPLNL